MKQLNDETFAKEIMAGKAIVMFSAPWAGPCNLVRPTFEKVASRLGNQIDFAEFNLDDNPDIPEKYGVRQIPLFIAFVNGKPMSVKTGAMDEETILVMCNKLLEAK